MAGYGTDWEGPATPNRHTKVYFDIPQVVLAEPSWYQVRGPKEIKPTSHPLVGESTGVMQLDSGWWGLIPQNHDHFEQHETTLSSSAVIRLSDVNAIGAVAERPSYRKPTELPGALDGASPDLQTSGDHFFWMKRPAGASWNTSLLQSLPMPELPKSLRDLSRTPHVPLDRVLEGKSAEYEDTGFLLRWSVPGNPWSKLDWVWRFYFGGPLSPEGLGQFCLTFGGNGIVRLDERDDDPDVQPPVVRWVLRDSWQFANAQSTVNTCHVMRIIPHAGRFIEFKSHLEEQGWSMLTRGGAQFVDDPNSTQTRLHTVSAGDLERRTNALSGVTGAGPVRADVRRDVRLLWQISRLIYRAASGGTPSGVLVDNPVMIPWGLKGAYNGLDVPVNFYLRAYDVFPDALQLYNGETGAELPRWGGTGNPLAPYLAPGGKGIVVPKITLAKTPTGNSQYFKGYYLSRQAQYRTVAPGAFQATNVRSVSVTGPDSDPSHETARLHIEDPNGEMPRFRKRGLFSCRIETEYRDPADGLTKTSVLFRGYAKPRAQPRPAQGREYPGSDWATYDVECAGWWLRLQAQLFTWLPDFSFDPDTAVLDPAKAEPWTVTHVIRQCLADAGWPEDQIDVPELPMRLWSSNKPDQQMETWRPSPGTSIAEYLKQIAWQFLGGYLLPDPNAGANGMWRLKLQPRAGTPLWTFSAAPAPRAAHALPHCLDSYPDGTSPILKIDGESSLRTWVEPAEGNAVFVCALGEISPDQKQQSALIHWGYNPKGIDWEGSGTVADPDHPDYLAMLGFAPVIEVDATWGAFAKTRGIWATKRLYDQACHAREMAAWTGHLVLVADPSDTLLAGKRRMLRYGDTILLDNGDGTGPQTYLIRSANADYGELKDATQLAYYEGMKPPPTSV